MTSGLGRSAQSGGSTPWEAAAALPAQVEHAKHTRSRWLHHNRDRHADHMPLGGAPPLGVPVPVRVPGAGEAQVDVDLARLRARRLERAEGDGAHESEVLSGSEEAALLSASSGPGARAARGSMTLDQLAEVMPWELHPAPEDEAGGALRVSS